MRPRSAATDALSSRFFGYLLACVGAENEVIQLHSGLNEKIKMLGYTISHSIDKGPSENPQDYINQPGFGTSPNVFCEQLLTSKSYDEILDVGCGPGEEQCIEWTGGTPPGTCDTEIPPC